MSERIAAPADFLSPLWTEYEKRKGEWISENPGATPKAYADAVLAIAASLGL